MLALLSLPGPLLAAAMLAFAGLFVLLLREELRYRRLAEMERNRNAMLAILSHRLRTPLTAMKWYTEMLLGNEFRKGEEEECLLALHRLDDGVENAIHIVNGFLGFSQQQIGNVAMQPAPVDLQETIRTVLDSLRERIRDRRISVQFESNPTPIIAYIDPMLCHAVLDTTISNATIYTNEEGVVRITLTEERDSAIVAVEDNGIGIVEGEQRRIFTQFFRGERAKKHYTEGAGLGLALASELLRKSHGNIWFESPPQGKGQGTVFFVQIPKEG